MTRWTPKPTARNIALSLAVASIGLAGFYVWFFTLVAASNAHPYILIAFLGATAAAVGATIGYGETRRPND